MRAMSLATPLSPLTEPLPLLHGRGYAPIELTDVMCRPLDASDAVAATSALQVAPIAADEGAAWARAAADGWSEHPEIVAFVGELSSIYARTVGATCFAARIDGEIAATGVLAIHGGVALLAGAKSRPAFRRRGAQTALLSARLRHAHDAGCFLAMVCTRPGSDSHRNAERRGFRVAYTRIKWRQA